MRPRQKKKQLDGCAESDSSRIFDTNVRSSRLGRAAIAHYHGPQAPTLIDPGKRGPGRGALALELPATNAVTANAAVKRRSRIRIYSSNKPIAASVGFSRAQRLASKRASFIALSNSAVLKPCSAPALIS
jgi:hypothetical protein